MSATKMNDAISTAAGSALTRRAFAKSLAWASAAFAALPSAFRLAFAGSGHSAERMRPPVVWFYMDRLHLDVTGTAIPYFSPDGMRSGAPLAHLSEEAFRRAQLYV